MEIGHTGRGRLAGLGLPWPERLSVDGDQGPDERTLFANHHALTDQPVRPQPVLEYRRSHILARGGDQDVLLAAGDREVAVVVELAEVTAVEPDVPVEHLARRLVVVPVALKDVATLDEHLTVLPDADRAPGDRAPDRTDALPGRQVEGHPRTGLGERVAIEHRNADPTEEVAEPRPERRPTTDRPPNVSTKGAAELGVDQPVEDRMPEPEQQTGAAGVQGLAVGGRRGVGEVEDASLAFRPGLVLGCVVDALKDPWHRQHGGRAELHQLRDDVLEVAGVPEVNPVVHRPELDGPRQNVRERE